MSNRQKVDKVTTLGSEPHRRPADIEAWCEQQRVDRAGHHGVNAYNCDTCHANTVTIDVDPGVTPMFLGCRRTPGCRGMASSSGYPDLEPPPHIMTDLDFEWATPTEREFRQLEPEMKSHVDQGGLVLHDRTDRPSAYIVTEKENHHA
jgi:hypothetical protein